MLSSAVSSVRYRDAAGGHSEIRLGSYVCCSDAASFHEWGFRTQLWVADKTSEHDIEAIS